MARRAVRSIFLNAAAWTFLVVMIVAAFVALFSATGSVPQVFNLGRLQLRTTSTAVVVMVVTAVPLWALLHYAASGRVLLFDDAALLDHRTLIQKYAQPLQILSVTLAVVGIFSALWIWLSE